MDGGVGGVVTEGKALPVWGGVGVVVVVVVEDEAEEVCVRERKARTL